MARLCRVAAEVRVTRIARALVALLACLGPFAHAEPDLPSYKDEVVIAAWTDVDAAITASCDWPEGSGGVGVPIHCDADHLRAVIAGAQSFERTVVPDGRIRYLIGLAHRHLGEVDAAEAAFREALKLAPNRAEAWFDLGELLAGKRDWDGARDAFTHVTTLVPSGPRSWPGWLQLAQADAQKQDAVAFEAHLRNALRYGMNIQVIAGDAAWKGFLADPVIGTTVERMITVYGGPEILASLKGDGAP